MAHARKRIQKIRLLAFKKLLSALALAAFSAFVFGQKASTHLRFEHFLEADGLSSQNLFDLKEGKDGFLWIGANNGLNRFDGIEFRQFFSEKSSARAAVPAEKIRAVTEAPDGNLWLASAVGIFFLNPNANRIRHFSEANGKLPTDEVIALKVFDDGQIFAGTEKGLAIYDAQNDRFGWAVGGEGIGEVFDFLFDDDQRLWLATSEGLLEFEIGKGLKNRFLPFPTFGKNDERNRFFTLLESSDGRLWAGGATSGLWLFDREKGQFERNIFWDKRPEKRFSNVVFDIEELQNEHGLQVWLGTNAGIVEVWPERGDSLVMHAVGDGFLSDCRDICFTENGSMWVATAFGLAVSKPNSGFFRPHPNAVDEMIRSMAFSEKDRTWLAVGNRSIFRLDSNFLLLKKWPLRVGGKSLEQPALRDIAFDGLGRPWISGGSGLFIFDEKSGQARQIAGRQLDIPADKNDRYFLALERLPSGRMAAGTWRDGLFLFDEKTEKGQRFPVQPGAADALWDGELFNLFWHEKSSRLFVGTRRGVAEMDVEAGSFKNYFSPSEPLDGSDVTHFSPSASGNVWVGTDKHGMAVFEPKKGFLGRFGLQHGLPDRQIQWTHEEASGKIWLLAGEKVVRFDPARPDASHVFLKTESPPEGQSFGSFTIDGPGGGQFLIGYNGNSFFSFSPQNFREMPPSRPYLTGLKIGGRDTFFEKPLAEIRRVDLAYWQNSLTFEFSAVSLENGPNEQFFYQLAGIDAGWQKRPKTRSANYAFLPPGEYKFRLKSTFSEQSAELLIVISKPFWATWWFRIGAVLGVGGLFFYFFQQRLLRKLAVERTRNRIARDLHDSLASDLSAIPAFNEVAKMMLADAPDGAAEMIDRASEVARASDESVRNIIWAADPELDTLGDLAARLREKMGGICEAKNIALEVRIDGNLNRKRLDIAHRSNLFFIAREAVQNAVKYADCSRIEVFFARDGQKTRLEVADDGCGFDPETVQRGNGLRNMERRAKEMKARLEHAKTEAGGARWRLFF